MVRREMRANRSANAKHCPVNDRLAINRMRDGFAHFYII